MNPDTGRVREHRSPEPVFTVLFVCTGNICRSALAERLGRAYLDQTLGEHVRIVRLASAGSRAVVGSAMHPDSALVLGGLGGEPGDFVAQQLTDELAAQADLTLTMTRAHRRDVLALAPRKLASTFTLREAAALVTQLDAVSPTTSNVGERLGGLVRALAEARAYRSATAQDDITDPVDQPVEVQVVVGETIAEALLPVLRRIAELVTARPTRSVGHRGSPAPARSSESPGL
jgi:protein-tyrosine phosphatase